MKDPILEIVTRYALEYKLRLQQEIKDETQIEIKLNEWIKTALDFCDKNAKMTPEELERVFETGNIQIK